MKLTLEVSDSEKELVKKFLGSDEPVQVFETSTLSILTRILIALRVIKKREEINGQEQA